MLNDVIGGHQEYIFMKIFMAYRILQLAKSTRDKIIKSLRSRRFVPSRRASLGISGASRSEL